MDTEPAFFLVFTKSEPYGTVLRQMFYARIRPRSLLFLHKGRAIVKNKLGRTPENNFSFPRCFQKKRGLTKHCFSELAELSIKISVGDLPHILEPLFEKAFFRFVFENEPNLDFSGEFPVEIGEF